MIELQGFDKFIETVKQLPDKTKGTVMAGIMRKNLTPVSSAIKALAPVRAQRFSKSARIRKRKDGSVSRISEVGNLKKSIGIKTFNTRKGVTAYAGIQKKSTADGWYGNFVERGTKYQAPNPFIKRAASYTVPQATKSLEQDTKDYIVKNAKKLGLDAK